MTEAQRQLLNKILASPYFVHAQSLQRILRYLCEHAADKDSAALREAEIATKALGRPLSFDPKIDPIVRVSIGGIRERLHTFFELEGKGEILRLLIPKGEYRVSFQPAPGRPARVAVETGSSALERFWKPYVFTQAPNSLVYTELLFFRDDTGNYVRNIYVNQLPGLDEIRQRLPVDTLGPLTPSFHFLSAGEVHCSIALTRALTKAGADVDFRNSRFTSWNDLQYTNLILIGSSRTNSFSDSLQGNQDLVITPDHIENRFPRPGEQDVYRGTRFREGKLERLTEYALITRRPGLTSGTVITMIAANHGRAIEGAGLLLSNEMMLQQLAAQAGVPASEPFPDRAQYLLRVDMIDFDEEVIHVEPVLSRRLEG